MDRIIGTIDQCLDNPEAKRPPHYLDLRNGKLSLKADFVNAADYTH
jgi:hypothetical protein